MNLGKLYIVATPIGNLADITFRAVETLKTVDFILCEDTRVTQTLLNHYEIKTKTISYHQHSEQKKVDEIVKLLTEGKNLALVTDAGTPGISDPGNLLVSNVISTDLDVTVEGAEKSLLVKSNIIPIPGSSAVIAALSISGFSTDKFTFFGFPPHKNKRKKFFQEVADCEYTAVFYESAHRIKKCLTELNEVLLPKSQIVLCRELTKKFETIYRGTIKEIMEMKVLEKGEFVIVVNR